MERIVAKGGRLRFEPTPEQRRDVEMMAALGIPPEQMCHIVCDKNGKPIRLRTFLRHFRQEIETGAIKVKSSVVSFIIATILGTAPPDGGEPITDERVRAKLAILYARAVRLADHGEEGAHQPHRSGRQTGPVHLSDSQGRKMARLDNLARAQGTSGDP